MTILPNTSLPFVNTTKKNAVKITLLTAKEFAPWLKKQKQPIKNQINQAGYNATPPSALCLFNDKGMIDQIIAGVNTPIALYDGATIHQAIKNQCGDTFLSKNVFYFHINKSHKKHLNTACIGWGLAAYRYDEFKQNAGKNATLLYPENVDKQLVKTTIESIALTRDLVNTPPNILGTEELAAEAKNLAKKHKAKATIIKGEQLLKKNFPLIYTVGKASERPPHLVDIQWGKPSHPKITIVGKGIVYDTGGLNLKPGQFMRDMKKDMGGAAHALGLAHYIMAQKLPVQLRVLLPIAENSVSGNSYRPGDVYTSRKGITVEINDTDAEGRLVVADALAYACEGNTADKPDLLIDFCTLTGAARVALGYDIPAYFSNNDDIIDGLKKDSLDVHDPVWPLPLWPGYDTEINSNVADIMNDGTGRAGAIHAALFLQRFIDPSIDWVHFDCFAWEQNGKPGRPKGGADTGLRAMTYYIEKRFLKK